MHNCRSIHGSPPNWSKRPRPLLLCAYSAGDALPITDLVAGGQHGDEVVEAVGLVGRVLILDQFYAAGLEPDWS
ncbi:MAG: hypothetical protein Ct9H300mP8_00790 [Gammaproteobacteria bacterium]|nr:MAG: hypothetical protein Ct9H300mP8_00790 [Gammaproteobacteria bacterium]